LKHNNRRPENLQAWWNVVNWDEISKRFEAFRSTTEPAMARGERITRAFLPAPWVKWCDGVSLVNTYVVADY
jgi:hypothetical protein